MGNKSYYSALQIMKSKRAHRKNKLQIYKTIIPPMLRYGCEAWTPTQTLEKSIAHSNVKFYVEYLHW